AVPLASTTRAAIVPVAQSAAVPLPVDTPSGTGGQNSPVGVPAGGRGHRTAGAKSRGAPPPLLEFRRAKSSPVTATTTGTSSRLAGRPGIPPALVKIVTTARPSLANP